MENYEGHPGLGGGGLLGSGSSGGGTSVDAVEASSGQKFSKQAKNLAKNSTYDLGMKVVDTQFEKMLKKRDDIFNFLQSTRDIENKKQADRTEIEKASLAAKKQRELRAIQGVADAEFLHEYSQLDQGSRASYSSILGELNRLSYVRPESNLPVGLTGINDDLWALKHKVSLLGFYTGNSRPLSFMLREDLQKRGYLGKWAGDPRKFGVSYEKTNPDGTVTKVRPDVPHIGDPFFALDPKQMTDFKGRHAYIMPGAISEEKYPGYMSNKPGARQVIRHELAHETSDMLGRFATHMLENTPAMVSGPIIDFLRSAGLGQKNPVSVEELKNAGVITRFLNLSDNEELLNRYEDSQITKNTKSVEAAQKYLGRHLSSINDMITTGTEELKEAQKELEKHAARFDKQQMDYLDDYIHVWSRIDMDELLDSSTTRTMTDIELQRAALDWQQSYRAVNYAQEKIDSYERELIGFNTLPEMWSMQMGLLDLLEKHGIKLPDVYEP